MLIKQQEPHHIYHSISNSYSKLILTKKLETLAPISSDLKQIPSQSTDSLEVCHICFSTMKNPVLLGCSHKYCSSCITNWVSSQLNDGKYNVPCMHPNCHKIIQPSNVLSHTVSQKLNDRMFKYAVLSMSDHIRCKDCNQTIGFGSNKWFACIPCYHQCSNCQQNNELNKQNEDLSRLFKKKCRKCPWCKIWIDKYEGCDYMMCRCGGNFCWKCGRKWRSEHKC